MLPRSAFAAGETSLYDFTVQYKGQPFPLSAFKDKARGWWLLNELWCQQPLTLYLPSRQVTVIMNVASE